MENLCIHDKMAFAGITSSACLTCSSNISYHKGDVFFKHCGSLVVCEKADLVSGCRLDERRDHPPKTPEYEGRVQKPELRQRLWKVLLQDFEHCPQRFCVQITQPDACMVPARMPSIRLTCQR